jgi:hypothetical protein
MANKLFGKPKWKTPFELRQESDNKMDLKETGCADVQWTHFHQVRYKWWMIVNMVVPSLRYIKCMEFLGNSKYYYLFEEGIPSMML